MRCLTFVFGLLLGIMQVNAQNLSSKVKPLVSKISHSSQDTGRVSLLIKLGDVYSNTPKGHMDSALHIYQQALLLSEKLHDEDWKNNCLLAIGVQYGKLGEYKRSRKTYMQVITHYYQQHDLKKVESALHYLQFHFRWSVNNNNRMFDEAIFCLQQTRALYLLKKDTLKTIGALKDEADVNLNVGRLDLAKDLLLQVLAEYKAIGYNNLHHTYFLLAAVYHLKGDLHKELYYGIETVKSMLSTRDTLCASMFYYKLGRTYQDLGMYPNSLHYFQRSIATFKPDQEPFYEILYRISEMQIAEKNPHGALTFLNGYIVKSPPANAINKYFMYKALANCYLALHQNQVAERFLLNMIEMSDVIFPTFGIAAEMHLQDKKQICEFYLMEKKYIKAAYYLKKLMKEPQLNVSMLTLSEVEFIEFRVDSALGNFNQAIEHFIIHKRLTDSIFNVTKSNEIANLQISFESNQKDKNIQLLKKQTLIDLGKFERRKRIGNFLIAGFGLLILLLGVLYSRFLLKKRVIGLLSQKQNEILGKNHKLKQILKENKWLLKEVHHRVKNNLHIIISLLHSQSKYLKDEVALNAVMDSQHRVQAMSLIHQKLYNTDNHSTVYMPDYIGELVSYLKDSYGIGEEIFFDLEVSQVYMDVLVAVPVGLIINEMVTNALKYAFPYTKNDKISIKLNHTQQGEHIKLTVEDNGCGLPEDFDVNQSDSFGIILVMGLIDDLGGTFSLDKTQGTAITTVFNLMQANEM